MRVRHLTIVLASLIAFSALPAQVPAGQPRPVIAVAAEGVTQRIVLRDGSELIGRIVSVGPTSVQFESAIGTTTIPTEAIIEVKDEKGGKMVMGRYFFPNPNATRLIFAPTGRMLQKGEGYFSDYWIFFPGFAAGLTNLFSIGGGMSVLPGVGFDQQLLYFTPKLGIAQSEKFNAAIGALMISVPNVFDDFGDTDRENAGLLYGVGTWGGLDNSFTAGLGYGYANGDLASTPAVVIGGEARLTPRSSLVSENYMLPGGNMILSGGVRFMGRGLAIDFAITAAAGADGGGCCFPFLGFVYNWK
jgi:hypothetical protein